MSGRKTTEPKIVTFGCRLNVYESEVMRRHASMAGLEDAIIFNTCAVTKEAERQAGQAIRRARRENPNAQIIVTGCASQIDPSKYSSMDEVDQVIGNDLKLKPEAWGRGEALLVNDIMSVKETAGHLVNGFEDQSRAFLQVQNGCDHRCTFCIIPYGRGNSRSVPIGVIAEQVAMLVREQGYNEIVFTGVDVTSYGPDLPGKPTLGQMIRRVLAFVPELPRLRLSSLDPVEIDEDMWALIAEEQRFMPHLHLSLQAGDDMILKRMKRRHTRTQAIEFSHKVRSYRPEIVFGADIIAGFPTETDEMFENGVAMVQEIKIPHLHVFPYSEREGTPAAAIPASKAVPKVIRKERAKIFRELAQQHLEELTISRDGKQENVVVEQDGVGRSEQFIAIDLKNHYEVGSIVKCNVALNDENKLVELP